MIIALLVVALAAVGQGDSGSANRLAIIRSAPATDLLDQNDKPWRLEDHKGKVLLVSFIFTTCNGSCPATTHRMAQVQQELSRRGLLKNDQVRLVSISLDPKRDTSEVLRGYMRLYDVDPSSWSFLTGTPDKVAKVISAWGMWVRPAANAQLDHPSRIFLVDTQGRIREIYNLEFLRAEWVVEDMELLLRENR